MQRSSMNMVAPKLACKGTLAFLLVMSSAMSAFADETAPDPRRCVVVPEPGQRPDSVAKSCAEEFVARNGYTDSPPTSDEALLATESYESFGSWAEALHARRNTLKPVAQGAECTSEGCGVTFEYRDPTITRSYRMVTMRRDFTNMRMEHQSLRPAPGTADGQRCARLESKHNFKPKAGYVPDEKTAIAIAVAVWGPIYGEQQIESEKPYKAHLADGVWTVEGSLPEGWLGGVAVAEIASADGRVLRVSHGK